MDVTIESEEHTRARLLRVLAAAEVAWLAGEYTFWEVPSLELAGGRLPEALAIVRDHDRWSLLTNADALSGEKFCVFSCHFNADIPNSGFVGWLATELKRTLGTGVFVVCGQNRDRGGIFDYWGLPLGMRESAEHHLRNLQRTQGAPSPASGRADFQL